MVGAPGRERPAKRPKVAETINYKGRQVQVFPGDSPVEDHRWVLITEVKNGDKHYFCVVCEQTWWGKEGRCISHFLRIAKEGVTVCTKQPT